MSSAASDIARVSTVRPPVVTAAVGAYLGGAGVAVAYAVLVFTQVGTIADAESRSEAANLASNSEVVQVAGSFALLGVAALIFAGLFVRCGVTVARGRFGSRGGAWGITALAVVCLACNLTITGTATGRRPFDPTIANVGDSLPRWYVASALALQILALVLILGGAVLLTRPGAIDYATPPGLRNQ